MNVCMCVSACVYCVCACVCLCVFVCACDRRTGDSGQVPPKGAPVPDRVCVNVCMLCGTMLLRLYVCYVCVVICIQHITP